MIKPILLGIIVLLSIPSGHAVDCTTPEVIAGSLDLFEAVLVLCGFGVTGIGATMIKSIVTGRQILAAVMQSLDENEDINNLHLISTAGNQGNIKAVKQFMTLSETKPDREW